MKVSAHSRSSPKSCWFEIFSKPLLKPRTTTTRRLLPSALTKWTTSTSRSTSMSPCQSSTSSRSQKWTTTMSSSFDWFLNGNAWYWQPLITCTKGTTTESNIGTWRGQGRKTLSHLRMSKDFGSHFWSSTTPRTTRRPGWNAFPIKNTRSIENVSL